MYATWSIASTSGLVVTATRLSLVTSRETGLEQSVNDSTYGILSISQGKQATVGVSSIRLIPTLVKENSAKAGDSIPQGVPSEPEI